MKFQLLSKAVLILLIQENSVSEVTMLIFLSLKITLFFIPATNNAWSGSFHSRGSLDERSCYFQPLSYSHLIEHVLIVHNFKRLECAK